MKGKKEPRNNKRQQFCSRLTEVDSNIQEELKTSEK